MNPVADIFVLQKYCRFALHDAVSNVAQEIRLDLEQLVARIGFQHIHQRLAGMALRIETGPFHHLLQLTPQHRDKPWAARVSC